MKLYITLCLFSLAMTTMADKTNLDQVLHDGSKQFTAKMFYEVAKANKERSIVLSAYSVMPPLAQLALASVGESHDEILNAIGMPNDDISKAAFSSITSKLRSIKGVTLQTANKIYIGKDLELNKKFAAVARESFDSETESIDFLQREEAAKKVNAWVEDHTNHRIKDLVDPKQLTVDTRALLVNAIYFKGTWKKAFDENETRPKEFHLSKEEAVYVPTMHSKGQYKYTDNQELKAQILEISYEGDETSFVMVLPHEIDGINDLEEKLRDPSALDKAMNHLKETEVEVYLPKFKIETTTDLKKTLEKIHLKKMFTPGLAKLEKLIENRGDLYIDSAVQKAFIEINEAGAEAAAANGEWNIIYV
ncbi:alaserpin-like [Vanessa tameamea]|uniref:Alaserpin-like n=1 Tax=Vanessa tameamea TaxID=334116 RepID=A0ABM4AJ21_VANTA